MPSLLLDVLLLAPPQSPKFGSARANLAQLRQTLVRFRLDCGRYPTTVEGLAALLARKAPAGTQGRWNGPYITGHVPNDPWGRPYVYRAEKGGHFSLTSLGADGKEGGKGDAADLTVQE